MIDAGYVRYVGLSEMGVETIRRANAARPVTGVQARPPDAVAGSRYDQHQMAMLDSER
ncbi:MAG TPA: hypothetical protein VFE70_03550 [Candidatus Elarobacter sp.]|nr:hypothetical protein [Candidatus Elarobacter sp.]